MNAIFALCATALFVQGISGQCLRGPYNAGIYGAGLLADGLAFDGLGYGGYGLGYGAYGAYDGLGYGAFGAYDGLGYGAYGLGYDGLGYGGLGYGGCGLGAVNGLVAPSSGGGFAVTSSSPIAPIGLSVTSENVMEGILAVAGELPVLSAVALEGALPTIGSGAIAYGCGDGSIGIVSDIAPIGPIAGSIAPIATAAYGFGAPFAGPIGAFADGYGYGRGCGCGAIY